MRRLTIIGLAMAAYAPAALACAPVDFLALDLPASPADAVRAAILAAYPDVSMSGDGTAWSVDGVIWHDMSSMDAGDPNRTLEQPDIRDQFRYVYPLAFDLETRRRPFEDPGRPRNDLFFRALWGNDATSVRRALVPVSHPDLPDVRFTVTTRRGVDCQLAAALAEIASTDRDMSPVFRDAAGGFNWRQIAGTDRLSAHSFGIAIDVNAEMGQYWRWTGAAEGAAGDYDNRIPEPVVRAMERFGFIWGGKWHHFDGMHFEYRPELILYARLMD